MSQVRCPYCNSVQVKAMSNQPKKYPRPTDPIALSDWQKGYDCKKCGNEFIVTPPEPKKPIGFFTKLLGFLLLAVIAFFIFMAIDSPYKDSNAPNNKSESPTVEASINTANTTDKDDHIFSQEAEEAEEAAHGDMPYLDSSDKKDSIADSRNQDDTLSIKTTIRESE